MYLTRATRASLETPFCHRAMLQTLIPAIINKDVIFPARMLGYGATVAGVAGFWFLTTFTIGKGFAAGYAFLADLMKGSVNSAAKKKRWNLTSSKL